jgi:hypothetical protein
MFSLSLSLRRRSGPAAIVQLVAMTWLMAGWGGACSGDPTSSAAVDARVEVQEPGDAAGPAQDTEVADLPTDASQFAVDAVPPADSANKDAPLPYSCPVAELVTSPVVAPLDIVQLAGHNSTTHFGVPAARYHWQVTRPGGVALPVKAPKADGSISFPVLFTGEYKACLTVWDGLDKPSCLPDCVTFTVIPDKALHIELRWQPVLNLPPPLAELESLPDLDLQLVPTNQHGQDQDCDGTPDPWFDVDLTCTWFNPWPIWDPDHYLNNPEHVHDSGGVDAPEVIWIAGVPEDVTPVNLHLGVHNRSWYPVNTAKATLLVWLHGKLVHEQTLFLEGPSLLWNVGKLVWPMAEDAGVGSPALEVCQQSGDACSGAGKLWQSNGGACFTPCYKSFLWFLTGYPKVCE